MPGATTNKCIEISKKALNARSMI